MSTNMERPDPNPACHDGFRGVDWTPAIPGETHGEGPGLTSDIEPTPLATMQASHPWPSTVSNFTLVEKVHEGRMSALWRAVDDMQNTVAVKLVPRDLVPTTDAQTLDWLTEVSEQPALLKLIEHGTSHPWWYQVSEWVEGETLEARRQAAGFRTGRLLPVWMRQIAAALDTLHLAGFVHGDVKPSNILLVDGKARLIDLMGVRVGASWYREGGLTPAFASPEARNGGPADPRDDVYSLAATMFLLLNGELVDRTASTDEASSPPAGLTASQWRALQNALNPRREQRTHSVIDLVDAMWPVSAKPQAAVRPPSESSSSITSLFSGRRSSSWRYSALQHWSNAARAAIAARMAKVDSGPRNTPSATSTASTVVRRPRSQRRDAAWRWSIAASVGVATWMANVNNSPSNAPSATSTASAAAPASTASAVASAPTIAVSDARPAQLPKTRVAVAAPRPRFREAHAQTIEPKHFSELPKAVPSAQPSIESAEDVQDVQSQSFVSTPAPVIVAAVVLPVATEPVADAERTRPGILPVRFNPPDRPRLNTPPARPDIPSTPSRPEVPVVPVVPEVPSRPDVPVAPNRPDVPIVPTRPEVPVVPTRPDVPVVPTRPEVPVVPVRPEVPVIPERPNRPDRPERPSRPDKPDRPDKPEKPEKPERPEKP